MNFILYSRLISNLFVLGVRKPNSNTFLCIFVNFDLPEKMNFILYSRLISNLFVLGVRKPNSKYLSLYFFHETFVDLFLRKGLFLSGHPNDFPDFPIAKKKSLTGVRKKWEHLFQRP